MSELKRLNFFTLQTEKKSFDVTSDHSPKFLYLHKQDSAVEENLLLFPAENLKAFFIMTMA